MVTDSGKAIVTLCAYIAQFDGEWSVMKRQTVRLRDR